MEERKNERTMKRKGMGKEIYKEQVRNGRRKQNI